MGPMKVETSQGDLDLAQIYKSIPGSHIALSLLGSIPGVIGLFGLTLRPLLRERLIAELEGKEEALQALNWVVVPENAIVLLGVAVLFSVPLFRSAMNAARQQLPVKR